MSYPYKAIRGIKTEKSTIVPKLNIINLYSNEIGYLGGIELTWVATVDLTNGTARPTHRYYAPHKTGKKLQKALTKQGFKWEQ